MTFLSVFIVFGSAATLFFVFEISLANLPALAAIAFYQLVVWRLGKTDEQNQSREPATGFEPVTC